MLGVELVNELVQDGKIELTTPVERTVTYHDPCRLNKRKGVHKAPRELLRAVPGITFHDVDRVTQWSYCSGGGGGLPIEKPEITAEISRRRVAKAAELEVDTLVTRLPVVRAPADRGRRGGEHRRARPVRAGRAERGDRAMTVAFKSAIDDAVIDELRGDHRRRRARAARPQLARVPLARPGAVPGPPLGRPHARRGDPPEDRARRSPRSSSSPTACRIPIVPRAGGTGLADGAVPLRGGILVDVKLMNQIHEIDLVDRTVTVGPGINMLKLNEELRTPRRLLSRRPGELPVQPRRRAHRHRRLVAAGRALRPHARQRDLDAGRAPDRRDRRDRRGRRPQAAALLHGPEPQAAVHRPSGHARDHDRGDARAGAAPRGRVRRVLRLRRLHEGLRDDRRADQVRAGDDRRRRALRRVEDRLPAPRRRGLHPAAGVREGRRRGGDVRRQVRGRAGHARW